MGSDRAAWALTVTALVGVRNKAANALALAWFGLLAIVGTDQLTTAVSIGAQRRQLAVLTLLAIGARRGPAMTVLHRAATVLDASFAELTVIPGWLA